MFSTIMVPVDLGHRAALARSLTVAADLAKLYKAKICYVGVTAETPSALAHTPQEYAALLDQFTKEQVAAHGHDASSVAYAAHDPRTDLDRLLLGAAEEIDADLVVMASHIPHLADALWASHGVQLARHAPLSVLLVRDATKD